MLVLDGLFRFPAFVTTMGSSDTNSFKRICSPTVLSPQALNWDADPSFARNIRALPSISCSGGKLGRITVHLNRNGQKILVESHNFLLKNQCSMYDKEFRKHRDCSIPTGFSRKW